MSRWSAERIEAAVATDAGPWRLALAAVGAACLLILAVVNRDLTFLGDDWAFVTERPGLSAGALLEPHNGHLSLVPVALYEVLIAAFGTTSYVPFQAVALLVHMATCLVVWALCRPRTGPWVALCPAAILALLGPAYDDLLWAFQVGFFLAMACGLGAWWCLERRVRRGDIAASALLVASLASSSPGIGIVAGTLVLLVVTDRGPRRLWVVVAPVVLYGAWYLAYGDSPIVNAAYDQLPRTVPEAFAAGMSSISGLARSAEEAGSNLRSVSSSWGQPLALAAVALLALVYRRTGRLPGLTLGAMTAALVLWTLGGLDSSGLRDPATSRYQYLSSALLLVAGCALGHDRRPARREVVLLVVLTGWVLSANVLTLNGRSAAARETAAKTRAQLGALELARATVRSDFAPTDVYLLPLRAGAYLTATDAHGSIADGPQAIRGEPEIARAGADELLVRALDLRPRRVSVAADRSTAGCRDAVLARPGTAVGIVTRPGAATTVSLSRFADEATQPLAVPAGTSSLSFPADAAADIPWRVEADATAGAAICPG